MKWKCPECPYFYQGTGDETFCCHFNSDEWLDNAAPCERDDNYDEHLDEED